MSFRGSSLLLWVISALFLASLTLFVSNLYARQALERLDSWKGLADAAVPSLTDWRDARRSIRIARKLNPLHPSYLDAEIAIGIWGLQFSQVLDHEELTVSRSMKNSDKRIKVYGERDLETLSDLLNLSIRKRPSWPYHWLNLARLKAYKGEFDDHFDLAYARANSLGSQNDQIKIMLIDAGLQGWMKLGEESEARLLNLIAVAIDGKYKQKTIALIDQYDLMPMICGSLPSPQRDLPMCLDERKMVAL